VLFAKSGDGLAAKRLLGEELPDGGSVSSQLENGKIARGVNLFQGMN
jgi:hypothetical protein